MASLGWSRGSLLLAVAICLLLLPGKAEAFGAGNIPSIAQVGVTFYEIFGYLSLMGGR